MFLYAFQIKQNSTYTVCLVKLGNFSLMVKRLKTKSEKKTFEKNKTIKGTSRCF